MAIKIKLMADYGCYPLWWAEGEMVGNIDPATLPLRDETVRGLINWATAYSQTLNWADPANSPGFPSLKDEAAFEREGISLWKQLRQELEPAYEVIYFSDRLQQLVSHPRELEVLT